MKNLSVFIFPVILLILSPGCQKEQYPQPHRDNIVDDYFGTKVADPYRWMEDANSPDTIKWVEEENKLTRKFLDSPQREQIKERLTKLFNFPRYSAPTKKDNRYFFWKNDGLQNQSVLYYQKSLSDQPEVLLNPNTLSLDGTISIGSSAFSYDGTLLGYGLSQSGSDTQIIKIKNVDTKADFNEELIWCRWPGIAFKHDNSGFFYDRYPEPNTVSPQDRFNFNKVYFHKLNTPQSQDELVYEDPQNKELGFHPFVTEDGQYLVLYVSHGTDPNNRIYYRPVESNTPFVKLLDQSDAKYLPVGNVGSIFYFQTDLNAPKSRIIAIDINNPAKENWREIIPQSNDPIDNTGCVNNQLIITYLSDVHHKLQIFSLEGKFLKEIQLPTLGSVGDLSGNQFDTEMFFAFNSFLYPTSIYRYDFKAEELSVFRKPEIDFNPAPYEAKQVFYNSKDGTRVPMFLVYKKGIRLDGSNPALLYAYGGFGNSETPYFSIGRIIWLEKGGIFALANIRGGGEYGEDWHRAAMKEKRQNAFDDFIAAGEYLIREKYTNPKKLAIIGGSNGGLLTAVCMLQRPDLYGAVASMVPVTDMLRFNKFTIGRYWMPEYGNPDDPNQFKYLYAYSPLHNIRPGVTYPSVFITSADTDDRVVPMHAKKFVATLQYEAASKNPILLRVETKAGHGHGLPMTKIIDETADTYAFLFKTLNLP